MVDARLVQLLAEGLEGVSRHEAPYYNDDARLGEAIRAAVFTKSGLLVTAALAQPTLQPAVEELLAKVGRRPFQLVGERRIQLFRQGLGDDGLRLLAVVTLASSALKVRDPFDDEACCCGLPPHTNYHWAGAGLGFTAICCMRSRAVTSHWAGAGAAGERLHRRRRGLARGRPPPLLLAERARAGWQPARRRRDRLTGRRAQGGPC